MEFGIAYAIVSSRVGELNVSNGKNGESRFGIDSRAPEIVTSSMLDVLVALSPGEHGEKLTNAS